MECDRTINDFINIVVQDQSSKKDYEIRHDAQRRRTGVINRMIKNNRKLYCYGANPGNGIIIVKSIKGSFNSFSCYLIDYPAIMIADVTLKLMIWKEIDNALACRLLKESHFMQGTIIDKDLSLPEGFGRKANWEVIFRTRMRFVLFDSIKKSVIAWTYKIPGKGRYFYKFQILGRDDIYQMIKREAESRHSETQNRIIKERNIIIYRTKSGILKVELAARKDLPGQCISPLRFYNDYKRLKLENMDFANMWPRASTDAIYSHDILYEIEDAIPCDILKKIEAQAIAELITGMRII